MFSSVVGGCGGTEDPGGCGVDGYDVSFCFALLPLPNTPAVASLSLLLNCLDSIGSGSLPIVPAIPRIHNNIVLRFNVFSRAKLKSIFYQNSLANKIATISTAAHSAKPITHSIRLRQLVLRRLSLVTYNFSPLRNKDRKIDRAIKICS